MVTPFKRGADIPSEQLASEEKRPSRRTLFPAVEMDVDGDGRPDLQVVPYDAAGARAVRDFVKRPSSSFLSRSSSRLSTMYKKQIAPLAATTSTRNAPGRTGIVIRGRDFITNVSSSTTGAYATSFKRVLNVADTTLFPWFGQLARLFETFKFMDLKFVYEPQAPASQPGAVGVYFDPDPSNTTDTTSWGQMTQRGANVHGAVWAKHVLNVPQALCASRREYYTRANYPPITIDGAFAYDPLEYFPGVVGVVVDGVQSQAAYVVGKVYVEYSCMLGKANEAEETTTNLLAASVQAPSGPSKGQVWQRVVTTTSNPANQVLIGPNATETIANNAQIGAGWSLVRPFPNANSSEYIFEADTQLKLIVTVSSNAGTWTNNCVEIGLTSVGGSTYTYSASSNTIDGIICQTRMYDAGVGTTAYFGLWQLNCKRGQRLAIRISSSPGSTQWWNQVPGYTVRMYTAPYDL